MDDAELYENLKRDLIPLGHLPVPTESGARWGTKIGSGWIMLYYKTLGCASILWSTPEDKTAAGTERTFEDSTERLTRLGQIHAALKPLGYEGEIEIGINDTPALILTAVPSR